MLLDWLQWPAMVTTLAAAWWVASPRRPRRQLGFVVFLASNALWMAWAVHSGATALLVLQAGLAAMNVRGLMRNRASQVHGPGMAS